jgi:phosphoadenosine phosphosulfate reductase
MELQVLPAAPATRVGEESSAEEIVAWSMERFGRERLALTTSFGMEGCVVIDMYAKLGVPLSIAYLDTMFFFPETYALRDRMAQRYPHLQFVNRGTTLTPEQQAAIHGEELWKTHPDLCCKIRKVDPMAEALKGADVWVTALRRSQSKTRANLRVVDWDWQYQLLKLCPLARWERKDVWQYIKKHDVPYNELHEKGYPSVGCTHCTAPVDGSKPDDYSRDGRWKDSTKTECGLHGYGI